MRLSVIAGVILIVFGVAVFALGLRYFHRREAIFSDII